MENEAAYIKKIYKLIAIIRELSKEQDTKSLSP